MNFNFEDVVLIIISWTFNLFYKYLIWENSAREKSKNCMRKILLFRPFFKTKLTLPVYIRCLCIQDEHKDRIFCVLLLLLFCFSSWNKFSLQFFLFLFSSVMLVSRNSVDKVFWCLKMQIGIVVLEIEFTIYLWVWDWFQFLNYLTNFLHF